MTQLPATSQGVTATEAAAILGVSTTTIRRMVKRGQLEGEQVRRPQGTAFVVYLPADPDHAAQDAAPTRQAAGGAPRGNAAPGASLMAMWSETFLGPIVAELAASRETIRDQAETIGSLRAELAQLRASNGLSEAPGSTEGPVGTPGPSTGVGPPSVPWWRRLLGRF